MKEFTYTYTDMIVDILGTTLNALLIVGLMYVGTMINMQNREESIIETRYVYPTLAGRGNSMRGPDVEKSSSLTYATAYAKTAFEQKTAYVYNAYVKIGRTSASVEDLMSSPLKTLRVEALNVGRTFASDEVLI